MDGAGNVYVADTDNDTIRKITPAGVVTTLAGTAGQGGSTDGTGSAALFDDPTGVAVDGAGNVYVADTGNDTIRKITPAGVVTTLAGTAGQSGSADGTGSAARFNARLAWRWTARAMSTWRTTDNDTIREITPAGVVTTLAGTAGQTAAPTAPAARPGSSQPRGVAVDGAGNVYVADTDNDTIRENHAGRGGDHAGGDGRASGSADGTGSRGPVQHPGWCCRGRNAAMSTWRTRATTRSARCPSPRSPPRAA